MNGTLNFSRETLIASMDFYTKNNQPVETHTNGSWAAEDYMTAIELAIANHPDGQGSAAYVHPWPDGRAPNR